ncbi:unnamed protein product [Adineta steineri]|uniref:Amine oxidase domain-containing protein n=1 Tax=Adineta steineri TaxID=433720 RepID=A0A814XIS9_9BILA|nr:unnamed protein product [Adineta steineri]CAF3934407.1 unnamed protein product [Adineta steineri]
MIGIALLSVTYKTNLLNSISLTIRDIKALNVQYAQILQLEQNNLSIISYNFTSTPTSTINDRRKRNSNVMQCEDGSTFSGISLNVRFSVKLNCEVIILGAGVGGSHSAYRLGPIYNNNLCIFERENHVGGRTYDIDYNGTVSEAYSTTPIAPMGAMRFHEKQPVIKQLMDELNISYYRYVYQNFLIKARGRFYTSYNEMCSKSYVGLNCTDDSNGLNFQGQIWTKLLEEYKENYSNLYSFADMNAFCRSLFGDEATEYVRDSSRFRSSFQGVDIHSYMDAIEQEWHLGESIHYPYEGMSQMAKRMIYKATTINNVRLFLNEKVIRIQETSDTKNDYIFSIETSNYKVFSKQLIAAIPPTGWIDIEGSIANEIKSNKYFQSILPIRTVIIDNHWPQRWWEQASMIKSNIDRASTRQNCISSIEILSQHPQKKEQNLTRTVYDDGLCIDTWLTLINRSSNTDLIQESLRGLRELFPNVEIPSPTKTFTKVWPGAWHLQKSNTNVTNKQLMKWALQPIPRFRKHQISLVGEAFNLDRSGWVDGAIKSSLMSLYSQFNFNKTCYENDGAVNGNYCSNDFI